MGRWRGKRYRKQKKAVQNSNDEAEDEVPQYSADWDSAKESDDNRSVSSFTNQGWSRKERRLLLEYLEQYKAGCECIYYGEAPAECHKFPTVVGMVELPLLTKEVYDSPYLQFPTTLTSKQRKLVHECCAETSLFHVTAGERFSKINRTICVSIYANGFDGITNIDPYYAFIAKGNHSYSSPKSDSHHPPIHQFSPWYCLKNRTWLAGVARPPNSKKSLDDQGKKLIDPFLDNPELSLRDKLDDMDFEKWDKEDLSDVPSPTSSGDHLTIVDTKEKMLECAKQLNDSRPTEIGFDLESYNISKFTQLTCLLQITSNDGHDFVIDPLAPGVWDEIGRSLAPFFADPSIVKVGHSIGGLDVRSLHRDFGIFVVNVFDTYEAAKVLNLKSHGLASVCQHYGMRESDHYKELKDQYQTTDWRRRPLTAEMLEYGRYDVHYLLKLRKLMIRDLTRADLFDRTSSEVNEEARLVASSMAATFSQFDEDDWTFASSNNDVGEAQQTESSVEDLGDGHDHDYEDAELQSKASAALLRMQPDLMKVISKSIERSRDLWSGKDEPVRQHPMYVNIKYRAKRDELLWEAEHDNLLDKIIKWRSDVARELQILPGFVAPLEFLIPVALQHPRSELGLRRVAYRLPELLETETSYIQSLLKAIEDFDEGEEEEEFLPMYEDRPPSGKRHSLYSGIIMTLAVGVAVGLLAATTRWKARTLFRR